MWFKRFFFIILGIFSVTFISKGWHVITGGFKTNKVLPPQDCICSKNELPKNFKSNFYEVFDQEYRYLDKGCQVYAFESKDKKYVIKFLRHHKYKPPFWLDFFVVTKNYRERIFNYKKDRVKNAFKSYLMAFNELKDETGVLYLHLGETDHFKKSLTIIDRMGQKWIVDLDKSHFVVQKKVIKLDQMLLDYCRKKEIEKAKMLIDGYFSILKKRCLKSIKNVDNSGYVRNMGYLEGKVLEIDLGGYRKRDILKTKDGIKYEFRRFSFKFKRWANKKIPCVSDYIEIKAKETLKECLEELK